MGNQVNSFPSDTHSMAAGFDYSGMTDGEPWGERWTVDGDELYASQYKWDLGNQGSTYTCLYNDQSPLPDGNYHLELYAGENLDLIAQSDVVVGGSGGGIPNQGYGQGVVTLYGQVYDANSNNAVAGADVYILMPGVTFAQWKADNFPEDSIFTSSKSDNQGYYSMPVKLALNVGYTVVAYAEGYNIQFGDNLEWTDQDPVDYQMDISMSN